MTTSKEFATNALAQLADLGDFRVRPMMGEYLLYYHDLLVGGFYDEQLLLKETPATAKYGLPSVIPYAGAKRTMYRYEDLNDINGMREVIQATYDALR